MMKYVLKLLFIKEMMHYMRQKKKNSIFFLTGRVDVMYSSRRKRKKHQSIYHVNVENTIMHDCSSEL